MLQMGVKHIELRSLLTNAIVELCRKEAFYCEELRIEGTVCLVSDRSTVLVAQIAEEVGDHITAETDNLPKLNSEQASEGLKGTKTDPVISEKSTVKIDGSRSKSLKKLRYSCPFCPKSYSLKHGLKEHLNHHTGRNPHLCRQCGMCFPHITRLAAHIRKEHPRKKPETGTSTAAKPAAPESVAKQPYPGESIPLLGLGMASALQEHQRLWAEQAHAMMNSIKQESTDKEEDSAPPEKKIKPSSPTEITPTCEVTKGIPPKEVKVEEKVEDDKSMDVAQKSDEPEGVANIMQNFMKILESQQQADVREIKPLTPPAAKPEQLTSAMGNLPPTSLAMMPPVLPPWGMGFPMFTPPTFHPSTQHNPNTRGGENTMTAAHAMPGNKNLDIDFQRSPSGKFQCPFCEKTYSFKHTLKDHINKHTGLRPHVCKYCGDSFTHLASLCAHIKRRHDNVMPSDYQCEICQEKFMNLQSLKQHFTWRHKDVKFVPPMVGILDDSRADESLDDSSVDSTLNSVTGNHSFPSSRQGSPKPSIPDPPSLDKQNSQNSENSKSDIKDDDESVPASISEYFAEINVRTEHGLYKYQCKVCGNMFKIRGSIYEHINSHLGKKPFVCNICGDAFAHHSTLHNHTRNKHSHQSAAEREAMLKHGCPSCSKKFRFRSELERHYRTNPDHNTELMGSVSMDFAAADGDGGQPVFPGQGNTYPAVSEPSVFPGQMNSNASAATEAMVFPGQGDF